MIFNILASLKIFVNKLIDNISGTQLIFDTFFIINLL